MNYTFVNYEKNGVKTIVAISHFAGKSVKGYAKLNPTDEFNQEKGEKLAAARCNVKVLKKRKKNAEKRYNEAKEAMIKAIAHFNKIEDELKNTYDEVFDAEDEVAKILEEI